MPPAVTCSGLTKVYASGAVAVDNLTSLLGHSSVSISRGRPPPAISCVSSSSIVRSSRVTHAR